MSPVSVAAVALSLAAIGLAWKRLTIARLLISFLLLLCHISASVYYYISSQTVTADSSAYYFDPNNTYRGSWGIGTIFVTKMCHLFTYSFGASYLDCFLLFQWFGFAGLMIMARVFDEIETNVGVPERRGYWALLFLPSVNFWTSAIGKDAPSFFAVALCTWTMLNFRSRFVYFCLSVLIMIAFRAHMALITATALAATAFFGKSVSAGRKLGLLSLSLIGILLASRVVESSIGVDATSISSVTGYISQQNDVFGTIAGTTSLGNAPYVVRVFSLLFRPLFFDAHGVQGIIASIENVGVVLVVLYTVAHWRDLRFLSQRVPFVRFTMLFTFVLLFLLSIVYYNIGLGLRERVMAYPTIFAFLVSLWSLRQKRSLLAALPADNRLMPDAQQNRPLPGV
jgi:hypothetical protein